MSKEEFDSFIEANDFNHIRVNSRDVVLDVYYDEPKYSPRLRDAYCTVGLEQNRYWIKENG